MILSCGAAMIFLLKIKFKEVTIPDLIYIFLVGISLWP
jgi:hypothetical protein